MKQRLSMYQKSGKHAIPFNWHTEKEILPLPFFSLRPKILTAAGVK
jgi:hypothetical protein